MGWRGPDDAEGARSTSIHTYWDRFGLQLLMGFCSA
jgi:hypothetical protein